MVAVRAGSLDFSITPPVDGRVSDLKLLLQPLTGAAPHQQRLLFKGKERKDDETLADLGLIDNARAMLLFTAGFVRPPAEEAPASSGARTATVMPVLQPFEPARPPQRAVVDSDEMDGVPISVSCLGVTHTLRVDPESTVADVKLRIAAIVGAAVDQQRLIIKGKERGDHELLSALALGTGAKAMVLFRAGFHLEAEGAEAVKRMVAATLALEARLATIARKQRHRLTDGHELLAALGALDADASAAELDLANARVSVAVDAQRRELLGRVQRLLQAARLMRKEVRV